MPHPRVFALATMMGLSACAAPLGAPPAPDGPGYRVQQDLSFLQTVNLRNQINAARARVNAAPLALDANLSSYARLHAQDMVTREYFSVVAPSSVIQTGDTPPLNEPMLWASFVKQMASGTNWVIPNHFKILLRAVPEEPQDTVWSRLLNDDPDGWLVNQQERLQIELSWFTRMGVGIVHNPKLKVYYAVLYLADGTPAPHQFRRRLPPS